MENNEKLIRADELKEAISSYAGMLDGDGEFWVSLSAVLAGIDFAPAVDAVPVVRCNDCLYFRALDGCPMAESGYFKNGKLIPHDTDFCSYGERRETDA